MNESDSEVMAGLLAAAGYAPTDREDAADVIILNTCSVRLSAENKAIGKMRELGKLKAKRPELILGFCGCMAQKHQEALFKTLPFLDFVCGTQQIRRIPELIEQARKNREYLIDVSVMDEYPVDQSVAVREGMLKAWVPIMRGCDNYCSYCVVPYVRGREVSRPLKDIVSEVRRLADGGCKEVTLLGQNVNSYGKGLGDTKATFPRLLEHLNDIAGIERIRFVTSHPKDISAELIAQFGQLPKLCEYLHFPIQAGSDRILSLMNRKYTAGHYLDIVAKLRDRCPGIALSTDIIVGYPTETEDDFQKTVEVMRLIAYDSAYIFKYSTREGTAAAGRTDDVPLKVKEERNQALLALQEKISAEKNQALVGSQVEILVEGASKRNPARMTGRTRQNKIAVLEDAAALAGKSIVKEVRRATAVTLYC